MNRRILILLTAAVAAIAAALYFLRPSEDAARHARTEPPPRTAEAVARTSVPEPRPMKMQADAPADVPADVPTAVRPPAKRIELDYSKAEEAALRKADTERLALERARNAEQESRNRK